MKKKWSYLVCQKYSSLQEVSSYRYRYWKKFSVVILALEISVAL